ncbi:MAG TPA: D-alanyl-D-alanine endopeptidase [Gallionellaceae bacterium]
MRNTLLTLLLLSSVPVAYAADNTAGSAGHDVAWVGEAPAAPVIAANGAVQATNLSGVTLAFAPDPAQSEAAAREEEFKSSMLRLTSSPRLRSAIGLIYDERSQRPLYSKSPDTVTPIASITKLMTAMVVLDAQLPMDEMITISKDDIDHHKVTRSRLRPGITMTRGELLKLALMASENRAAAALARTYPGGTQAALVQMNAKARELGMSNTRFLDPTGLNSGNVSTAEDLVKMVRAAEGYDQIHQYTTSTSHVVQTGRRPLQFHNTNPLVRNSSWDIGISKTGYISEAGRCLVMKATISQHPVIIVLLDSWGRHTRVGDANRVKQWMESGLRRTQL